MDYQSLPKPKLYLTSAQVRARYGGRSAMWLWRRCKYDSDFPKPYRFGKYLHWDEAELTVYDQKCRPATNYEGVSKGGANAA